MSSLDSTVSQQSKGERLHSSSEPLGAGELQPSTKPLGTLPSHAELFSHSEKPLPSAVELLASGDSDQPLPDAENSLAPDHEHIEETAALSGQ